MKYLLSALITALAACSVAQAATVVTHPYLGVTVTKRTETSPRAEKMNIVQIDLTAPGIRFKLTPADGTRETVRQTTLDFLNREQSQLAINGHFFLPFPSSDATANVVGLAASNGNVYSAFEPQPIAVGFTEQNYAIIPYAAALNLDAENNACIVHRDPACADNRHVLEPVTLYNTLSGSAQIVTGGVNTVPVYKDAAHPEGQLISNGIYSNGNSWYSLADARSVIGLTRDNKTLVLFTVDKAEGSFGMTPGEIADLLVSDYGVYNALNLDGGGSTSLAMADPVTHAGSLLNVSADNPMGRSVGSNLAIFALPVPFMQTLPTSGSGFHRHRRSVGYVLRGMQKRGNGRFSFSQNNYNQRNGE
jgi:hypothetical protein